VYIFFFIFPIYLPLVSCAGINDDFNVSLIAINANLNLKRRRTELGGGICAVVRSGAGYADGRFVGFGCAFGFSCYCCAGVVLRRSGRVLLVMFW
jgi:hypothetical protein